jgi:hydrogenase maturation protease
VNPTGILPPQQGIEGEPSTRAGNLLIGIGNAYRSDDGLGVYIAKEFRRRSADGLSVLEESGEGTSLMAAWQHAAHVFVVDAVVSGLPPGMLHRIDVLTDKIPRGMFRSSSHSFGICEAIELARELRILPQSLILYGIEGESFDHGVGLSASVVRSVPELIHVIQLDIRKPTKVHSQI